MSNVGDRLREERERLGLSQSELAEHGGIKKGAQINYEKGDRSPDTDYLHGIMAAGADVCYIVTGMRSIFIDQKIILTKREEALLDNYRNTSDEGKVVVEAAALAAAKPRKGKKVAGNKE